MRAKIDPICIMRRPRRVTPETAILEGLETLLRLARDARAGGVGQDPMAVAGSVVGVFCWGATLVWLRAGTGKGRFEEAGDKACKSLDLALRLALGVDQLRYRLFLLICCLPALGFVDAPSGTAENKGSFAFIA